MNNDIQEDYCSFEVSKLLKERGFGPPKEWNPTYVLGYIDDMDDDGKTPPSLREFKEEYYSIEGYYLRPTHALAIKWIRKNFDISIDVASYYNPQKSDKKFYEVGVAHKDNAYDGLMVNASDRISVDWMSEPNKYWLFDSPEEAAEAGLLHTLKILMMPQFTYQGYMSQEAQDFFKGYVIEEPRDGCAVVGSFIKLSNGKTSLPSKGDTYIKNENGIILIND